jgi:hypothetical protein
MHFAAQEDPLKRHLRSQDGIGLMMAVLSTLIISGMLAGFGYFLDNRVKERSINDIRKSRDLVYNTVLQAAADPNAIMVSRRSDSNLDVCVTQANPTSCSQFRRFSLKIPLSPTANGRAHTLTSLANTDVQGMFDRFGYKACSPASKCAYIAETWFRLECPSSGGSCAEGGFLRIRVIVRKNSSWSMGSSFLGLTSVGIGPKSSADDGADAIVNLKQIKRIALQSCPEGAFATGLDVDGRVSCRCGGSYVQNAASPLSCRFLNKCPVKEILVGYDANLAPICKPISLTSGNCANLPSVSGTFATVTCPSRGYMDQATPSGDCTIQGYNPRRPNANPGIVTCPPWTFHCCTLPGN